MTRNVKRFLAGSLLSLIPSIAVAGQVEHGFPDLLSERTEYVSLRSEGFQLPAREDGGGQSIGPALEDLLVLNQTGVNISLGIQVLTGTLNGVYNPYPIPTATVGGFQVSAPAPTVAAPVIQQYYWTVNAAAPATSKTCVWRVEITDVGGVCTGTVFFGTYGGALCTVDPSSFINPTTCAASVRTIVQ
ncbi:hypothetical protein [Myxococcus eversor]|uniref:hypothetical protein n=1 Tax=Myxococcus eversor TaxID=2709661 RepID=UPI0013CF9457|nr:hypothetical protein [Myxococcus eversor]